MGSVALAMVTNAGFEQGDITFITLSKQSGDLVYASVNGMERLRARHLCHRLFCLALEIDRDEPIWKGSSRPYHALLPKGAFPLCTSTDEEFFAALRDYTSLDIDDRTLIHPQTKEVLACSEVIYTTATVLGSPAVRFLAKLDAQCQLNTYIEWYNRERLARIVEAAIKDGFFIEEEPFPFDTIFGEYETSRDSRGWQAVLRLLRAPSHAAVVVSFSGFPQFPSLTFRSFPDLSWVLKNGTWEPEEEELQRLYEELRADEEDWIMNHSAGERFEYKDTFHFTQYPFTDPWVRKELVQRYWATCVQKKRQWEYGLTALRIENKEHGLEIIPPIYQRYGKGYSAFDLKKAMLEVFSRAESIE